MDPHALRNIAFAVLLLASSLALAPSSTAQTVTIVEDFNEYSQGVYPPIPSASRVPGWVYTHRGTLSQVVELVPSPSVSGQSLSHGGFQLGINAPTQDYQSPKIEMNGVAYPCNGSDSQVFAFDYRVSSLPSLSGGGFTYAIQLTNPTDSSAFYILINAGNPSGTVTARVQTSTGATQSLGLSGGAITANEWWHFEFIAFDCEDQAFVVTKSRLNGTGGFGSASVNGANLGGVITPPTIFQVVQQGSTGGIGGSHSSIGTSYYDNIEVRAGRGVVASQTPLGPSLSLTGLKGFDVDKSGTTLIARTRDAEGGTQDNVRTYVAGTLATPGNVKDTDCSRTRGVAALRSYVAFLECNEGNPSDVDFVMIRDSDLSDPDWPAFCSDGIDFCDKDLDANEMAGDQSAQFDLASIEEIPFDYSVNCDEGTFFNSAQTRTGENCGTRDAIYFAFGASFQDGTVGVITYVSNRAWDDKSQITRIGVSPANTAADQMCIVQDSDGQSYLYTAQAASQAKGFTLDFDVIAGSSVTASTLVVDMVETFSGTPLTNGAIGVGCGEQHFAIITPTTLSVFGRNDNVALWTKAVAGVPEAGLAMSGDGEWVLWIEGSTLKVAAVKERPATSSRPAARVGDIVATAALPPGIFVGLETDGQAQQAWIATDTRIQLYNALYQLTTGNATACNPGDVGCGGSPTTTTTAGPTSGDDAKVFGLKVGIWKFLAGLLLVGIAAGIAYRLAGPAPMVVGGAACLGIAAAVAIGWWNIWIPIFMALSGVATLAGALAKKVGART